MILGRKIGMTQVWDEDDNVVPVTVIQAGPCAVSQVKTQATDGYDAVQIGFGDIKAKNVTYNWHDPDTSFVEAVLSRGERRGAQGRRGRHRR